MLAETGIPVAAFAERRQRLADKMPPASIAILPGAVEKFRNHDAEYPFRQDSNFYYLTGFCEPQALLIMLKKQDGILEFILFSLPRILEKEIWTGKRTGQEAVLQQFCANRAYSITDADRLLPELLKDNKQIFYSQGIDASWDNRILNQYKPPQAVVTGLLPLIHEMRLVKSPSEIQLMRKAAQISADAHIALIKHCQPKKMEYELEALFVYECLQKGCRAMAYSPIVGGGKNACTLHYTANNAPLNNGELVLVDAGAEYHYYAADITRTYPINGKFTAEQKAIYSLVLKAQLAAINAIQPGTRWDMLQTIIVDILVQGLINLDLLNGESQALIRQQAYRRFYMHGSGHWLGLDVHDAGEYKIHGEYRTLVPGMVLTVEPGIYIAPDDTSVDKRWRGIGVRIEDDILVTETGYEILSKSLPKTIEAIENLMQKNLGKR